MDVAKNNVVKNDILTIDENVALHHIIFEYYKKNDGGFLFSSLINNASKEGC